MNKQAFINTTNADNGIYIVYNDGSYEKFAPGMKQEGIKYVGIIHDGHAFCVALTDLGRFPLVKDTDNCPDESPLYVPCECDALQAWDCVEQTKHIQEAGTDIPLADGEYIPALPMVVLMRHYAKRGLNDALKFAGGQPLDMYSYCWSATEYSSNYAWYVDFGSGNVNGYGTKYGGNVVRPVAAFNLSRSE